MLRRCFFLFIFYNRFESLIVYSSSIIQEIYQIFQNMLMWYFLCSKAKKRLYSQDVSLIQGFYALKVFVLITCKNLKYATQSIKLILSFAKIFIMHLVFEKQILVLHFMDALCIQFVIQNIFLINYN